jgi:hypothetical protein
MYLRWGNSSGIRVCLLVSSAILSMAFFGLQALLKVLYILRLGFGLEYVGIFSAVGSLTYMAMSLPSGALGLSLRYEAYDVDRGRVVYGWYVHASPCPSSCLLRRKSSFPIAAQVVMMSGWAMLSINAVPASDGGDNVQNAGRCLRAVQHVARCGYLPGHHDRRTAAHVVRDILLVQQLDGPAPYRWALMVGGFIGVAGLIPLFRLRSVEGETKEETVQYREARSHWHS